MLRISFILLIITLTTATLHNIRAQDSGFELKTVVIDPGHGGKDPGAVIRNIKEKDIVLDVALRTGAEIKKVFPSVNVIYTRDKDVFVPLDKRAEIANKNEADLFISLHVNSFRTTSIRGAETFVLGRHRTEENLKVAQMENSVILLEDDHTTRYEGFDPNSAESYIMFELIQNEFLEQSSFFADQIQKSFVFKASLKDRGVKQAGFLVLRQTAMPSVLVELGFLSNNNDKIYMLSNEGKTKMAQSIANAFASYKKRIDARSAVTVKKTVDPEVVASKKIDENLAATAQKPAEAGIHKLDEYTANGVWYSLQILASREELSASNKAFNRFETIFVYNDDGWYKYYVELLSDYNKALERHGEIKKINGEAFLVQFENGRKIKVLKY
ncbi:MAG: N-acetylmuramoyl-L-alanine amidase [Prolixibacteraceae bacterium]|jgi:N-acetylmuramoyl-L-alanine amidase|nr:N-acetylmuramoyl-L-alanine amidase [Prolixibacteraceae bacterium]